MNNFEILYHVLVCIKNNQKRHDKLGLYIDLSALSQKNNDELSANEYHEWRKKVVKTIEWLSDSKLIILNDNIYSQINPNEISKRKNVASLKICAENHLSEMSKETRLPTYTLIQPIYYRKNNNALTLLNYIIQLAKNIFDEKIGKNRLLCLQHSVLKFEILEDEIFALLCDQLRLNSLITEVNNTGGYADSYELSIEGKKLFAMIYQNHYISEGGITKPKTLINNTTINHQVGTVNNAKNIDTSTNSTTMVITTNINNNFVNEINKTTKLSDDEKQDLLKLYNKDPTFGSRVWEVFNSILNGASSGVASVVAGMASGG